jgi:Flp pilus assembly protein TadD
MDSLFLSQSALAALSIDSQWQLASQLIQIGRLNQSVQLAYDIANRDPSQVSIYQRFQIDLLQYGAEFSEEIGDFSRAVYYWGQLTQQQSHNPVVWYGLGIAYANLSDFSNAAQALQRSLQINPNDPKVQNQLSNIQSLLYQS